MNIDEFIEHTQETARKHRYHADFFDINNPMRVACIKSAEDCEQLAEWLEKSKEYQHLEEQGRLVKLPVKDDTAAHRECVPIKSTCYHENYKCSECPLTELFCDEFYKAIDRCREEAYTSGCLAGMDLAKSEADKISTSPYYDGYSKALDDLLNSLPDCDYVGIERLVCLVEQLKRGGEMEDRYLFKAKRVDNGEWWVTGHYVKGLDMYGKEVHLIFKPYTMFYSSGETDGWYKVDPTTICRCTGLRDKNGKLIWENDIVKINNSKGNVLITFGDFEIICTIPNEKYYKHRLEYDTEYEVVGNVFDNPELLESEE